VPTGTAAALGCRAALVHDMMRQKWGRIVNVTTSLGTMTGPDQDAKVHVGPAAPQHVHVFGEGLEPPVDACPERIEIHSLDHRGDLRHKLGAPRIRGPGTICPTTTQSNSIRYLFAPHYERERPIPRMRGD
jgi:NAD(P)-dependent dehydrogenase (short-subunit alcohol dehydrogenase family)